METVSDISLQVSLKIYDVLGRKISTLVDEKKVSGNYEVQFNGINLASGIYFYRLEIGNSERHIFFAETKSLTMLK